MRHDPANGGGMHGIWLKPCMPSSRSRKIPYNYDEALYRQRHKVENLFAKLKDWRRIATRYDKCDDNFLASVQLASIRIWLRSYKSVT